MNKILLVDDQVSNHYVLKSLVEDTNFGVSKVIQTKLISVYSGKECLDILLKGFIPNLIILDLDMPYMNGYEVLEHIRKIEKLSSIYILALSAHYEESIKKNCINKGFSDYISKPYNALDMINYIKKSFRKNEKKLNGNENEIIHRN